jgi:hypothetical protein
MINPDRDKNVKPMYTIRYTIKQQKALDRFQALEQLRNELIDQVIDMGDFAEAREVIAKIMEKK